MSVFNGRDWKQHPLTREEARLIFKRSRLQRRVEWIDFKQQWPMHLCELLMTVGSGTMLGVLLGMSLLLWSLTELAR